MEGVGISKVFGVVETCPLVRGNPSLFKVSGISVTDVKEKFWVSDYRLDQIQRKAETRLAVRGSIRKYELDLHLLECNNLQQHLPVTHAAGSQHLVDIFEAPLR